MLRQFDTASLVEDIARDGAIVIRDVLTERTIADLIEEADAYEWQPCKHVYGKRKVRQEYDYVVDLPAESTYRVLQRQLERHLQECFMRQAPRPVALPFFFNEARLQRYDAGSIGIEAHRDGDMCRAVIALFVLEGGGSFCVCDDPQSQAHARALEHGAGDLILMRGSDFLGKNIQPMHFVKDVKERRITFGLRQRGYRE